MHSIYENFIEYIQKDDKESAFNYLIGKLRSKEISIIELYTEILTPTLNEISYKYEDENLRIFEEHIYTGVVSSIIEAAYEFVIEEAKKYSKLETTVMVICPSKEYHVVGARMVSDFFTIAGFKTTYLGNDTPKKVIIAAIKEKNPDFIAVSVTNAYHLVTLNRTLESIKQSGSENVKIILGGNAIKKNQKTKEELGIDYIFNSFEDILSLREEILGGGKK